MPGTGTSEAASTDLRTGSKSGGVSRGPLSHPAVLAFLAAAVLFGAYALGYIPQVGSLLEDAIRSSRETTIPALSPAFYGIGGLAAFLLLLSVLRSFDILLRRFRKPSTLANRALKPVAQFLEEAAVGKISLRVARESYHMLRPHYPNLMCIALSDDLRADLGLSDEEIGLLCAQLLTRCDRRDAPATAAAPEALPDVTVFDLLHRVETAAPLRAVRPSASRERATDVAADLPVVTSRNPSSAERKALHAAALQAIESRSLRSPDASGLYRRSSDYEGPRRRATDNQADPVHKGPYRRASDRGVSSSADRKAVPVEDPAKLNRLDPLFVPPLNQRSSAHSAQKPVSGKVQVPDVGVLTSDRRY